MSYTVNIAEIQQGVTVTANTNLVAVTSNTQSISVLVNAVEFATGVTNAQINGAGNLIITLSNSTQLDAGQVVTSSTYGNTTVAAYLPTYSGSIGAATEIVTLTANAGAQSNQITGANAAIVTANTALKSYVDTQVTNLTANDVIQSSQIVAANAAIVTANTALKAYTDAQITTTQSWVTGANAAIVTANTALKNYVDTGNTTQSTQITTTQSWVTGANAAIVTANTAMKNYVDAVTTAWTSNAGAQANQITGANAAIVTANTALKSYVDGQITTTQSWVTGANAATVTANTALKGYVDQQFTNLTNGAPAILDTLGEIATSLGNNASLSTTLLNAIAGANAAIVTANTALKAYTDAQITTTQSWVTGANAATVTANTALKSYTDNQITTANTALKSYVDTQDSAITTAWTSNAGAQANQIAGANVNIARIDANLGSFQTYANVTFGTSSYANANVASYLPVFGGNILAGNVNIPYTSGTRNRGPLAIGGTLNHYDSGVVASFQGNEATYLYTSLQNTNTGNTAYASYAVNDGTHTYYGELGINSGTYDYAAAGYPNNAFSLPYATFVQSTGANLAVGTYSNHGISFLVNGQTTTADAMTIATTGLVNVAGNLAVGTTATVGNIASTSGYFWANGTVYSTGTGGGTSFDGNLTGNALTDTTNLRVLINASAYSAPTTTSTGTTSTFVNTKPVYTAGVLQSPTLNTTVGAVVSANIAYQSGYQTTTNKTYTNFTSYAQVWPQTANIMVGQDRVRATATQLDVQLNGKTWGSMTTASQAAVVLGAQGGQTSVLGSGSAGSVVGAVGSISVVPASGSANVQYATGQYAAVNHTTGATGATASNIVYARLFAGAVAGQSGNLTVANAVALHTFNGWVSSNVSLVTNAYVILNEDTRSIISTVGNIAATGAVSAFGNLKVTGYVNPSLRYSNPSSGNVAISGGNMQSYQQISLGGNIGITAVSTGLDTVYDFKIEQDATGSRTVTWYDASGAATPSNQIEGALNPIPFSATYARCIMSSTGLWTVAYGNPALQSYSNTSLNAATGSAGMMFAVSTNGNKPCYWDTTNSRWSYVFDNSAV